MRFTARVRALALSIAVLRFLAADLFGQTEMQGPLPPAEWTLDDVLRSALVQHPLIQAARDGIDAAGGTRRTAETLSNPVATYWTENGAFPGQVSLGLERETSAYLTFPLEPLFQRAPRIRRADADVKAAQTRLAAARRQVGLDAAHAFYRVALAQVTFDAAEENRKGLEQLVAYNGSRVAEGATAEVELIRVQVELDRAATQVALADADLIRSRAALWPYISTDRTEAALGTLRVSVPTGDSARITLAPRSAFRTRAEEHRPELLSAAARVSAATADVDVQHALMVRQVGATFGLKRIAGQNSMIAGLSVPVPLFDQNHGEVQRATGDLHAAQHELEWVERTVDAEINAAYAVAQRLSAQLSTLERSFLERAAEANRVTLGAYQEGGASLLQVLDASRTLADARLTYYRAVLAQRQSLFDLAMAAGDEPATAQSARFERGPDHPADGRR